MGRPAPPRYVRLFRPLICRSQCRSAEIASADPALRSAVPRKSAWLETKSTTFAISRSCAPAEHAQRFSVQNAQAAPGTVPAAFTRKISMGPSEKSRLTHQERIAAIQAVRTWIPLADQFPEAGQHVLVKMDDGLIEIAHWDSARAGWSHSPFERWGRPEFWAPLTPFPLPKQESKPIPDLPISGTPLSRVRPERGQSHFGFKFLSAFLQ
jgi:hypothetical protein